jgi:transposase
MNAKYSTYEVRERAIRAVLKGHGISEVAATYGIHRSTLHRWVNRYEERGSFEGLARRPGSGRHRILDKKMLKRLYRIVLRPATEFGYETDFWTCRRLIQVVWKKLGVKVSQPTMWRVLRDCELTYQKPERRYMEASERKRNAWIRHAIPKIKRAVTEHRAILYCEDESNLSLTSVLGKTWAPKGQTPKQSVTGRRGGVAAMSAISQRGSLVFVLHEKRIASTEVIHFLEQLLKHHPRRHLVVVMDQAPPHTSKRTKAFIAKQKRLHVFHLPPYSPDFNPDEQVWNHLKHQELKSHPATTKKQLKGLAHRRLRRMAGKPSLLRGIFFRCYVADLLN